MGFFTPEAELKEGGKDIEVTFENREEYVRRREITDQWRLSLSRENHL